MLNPDQVTSLRDACAAAVSAEQATGCPAELTVAQWAQESGWGVHEPGNNPFGIKDYHGGQVLMTSEHGDNASLHDQPQPFAVFQTLAAAFEAHGKLIAGDPRYSGALSDYQAGGNLESFIEAVAVHYAKDKNYAARLLEILRMPQVQAELAAARH